MRLDLPTLGSTKLASEASVGRVRRVRLDRGGYAASGEYYGTGERVYEADIVYQVIAGRHSDVPFIEYKRTLSVRAATPQEARERIVAMAKKLHGKHGGL